MLCLFFCDRFNGLHWFCVKNLCTKYCCKSLNKQSSGVQGRINPFYINSYGENNFGLRKFWFTNDLQERIKFVNRGLTVRFKLMMLKMFYEGYTKYEAPDSAISPASFQFLARRFKYSPQHSVFKHLQLTDTELYHHSILHHVSYIFTHWLFLSLYQS